MEALRKPTDEPDGKAGARARSNKISGKVPEPVSFEQPSTGRPNSLMKMADEMLEFYAFVFCQRGFRQLGMTFEQFLEVVDVVRPGGLRPTYEMSQRGL